MGELDTIGKLFEILRYHYSEQYDDCPYNLIRCCWA